jgi:hypothetical protein
MPKLCNYETPNGPCTMVKGHKAKWHRHIDRKRLNWHIHDQNNDLIHSGIDKVPLIYAMNDALAGSDKIVIEVWTT